MASAQFTVNSLATPPEIAVSGSSTVTLALTSTSGVRTVVWSIVGNSDSSLVNPTITPGGSPSGATATFTMPAGTGQGYLIKCVVNGGVDDEGVPQSQLTKTAIVGVNSASGYIPFVNGETYERDATYGWVKLLNQVISGVVGGGTPSLVNDSVTFAIMQNIGVGLIGNDSGTADPKLIPLDSTLAFSGGAIGVAAGSLALDRLASMSVGLLGNDSGTATPKVITLSAAFAFSAGALALATGGVGLSNIATIADQRILGNVSGGTASPIALTGAQATGMLSTFVASGASHAKGLVPDPGASSGTTKFLREDATWAVPAGSFTNPSNPGDNNKLAYANAGGLSYASAVFTDGTYLGLGALASLPSTGKIRHVHNSAASVGKTNGGSDANLLRWGTIANDTLVVGDDNVADVWVYANATLALRLGAATEWTFSTSGLNCGGNGLTNLATINGTVVATGVLGSALTDANVTLTVAGGNVYELSAALTANRSAALGITGPPTAGEAISIRRYTTAAFTYTVTDEVGNPLYVFPAGQKRIADFVFTGTKFALAEHMALS